MVRLGTLIFSRRVRESFWSVEGVGVGNGFVSARVVPSCCWQMIVGVDGPRWHISNNSQEELNHQGTRFSTIQGLFVLNTFNR